MNNPFSTHTPKRHALLAPSSLARILKCTGSVGAGENNRDLSPRDASNEGTIGHDIFEECMRTGGDATAFVGRRMVPSNGEIFVLEIDKHFARAVDMALATARVLAAPLSPGSAPGVVLLEQAVELRGCEAVCFGRFDLFAVHRVKLSTGADGFFLRGLDLKMGFTEVEVEANAQLMGYATMLLDQMDAWDKVEFVELTIAQPRLFYGNRLKTVNVPIATLREFRAVLVSVVDRVSAGDRSFNAGAHCRYCERLGMCPASADLLRNLLTLVSLDPAAIGSEKLGFFLDHRKLFDTFTRRAESILKERGMRGEDIGRPIVSSHKHRQWRDEAVVVARLLEEKGASAVYPPTPAQVSEQFPDLRDFVDANAFAPEGEPVVGTPGDKRRVYTRRRVEDVWAGRPDAT